MQEFIKSGQKVKLETPEGTTCTGVVIGVIPDVATGHVDYIVKLDERIGDWPYYAVAVNEHYVEIVVDADWVEVEDIDFDKLANDISDFKA